MATKLTELEERVKQYQNMLLTFNMRQEAFRIVMIMIMGILCETQITLPKIIISALREIQLGLAETGQGDCNIFIEDFINAMEMGGDTGPDPILPIDDDLPEGETKH